MRRSVSKTALLRDDARRAVGAHLNVQWSDAPVPEFPADIKSTVAAYEHLAQSIPAVKKGEFPSMIFIVSDEQKPPPKMASKSARPPDPGPTKQAMDSEAAWVELFQTEGEYSTFIPGRFFNILKVDTTQIKSDHNKYVYSENAPVVILTRKNGDVATYCDGRARIKRSGIVSAMCDVLKKDGFVQNVTPLGRLRDLMRDLENAEIALVKTNEKLEELSRKLADAQSRDAELARKLKKPLKASSSTVYAEKALEEFKKATLLQAERQKFDILAEEYSLLKEIGLPAARLPKEPAKPGDAKPASGTSS